MFRDFLILGGAGLVGTQVVRHIVKTFDAAVVISSGIPQSGTVPSLGKMIWFTWYGRRPERIEERVGEQ